MPDELVAIASAGEFDEFDLNAFFESSGTGVLAQFKHKSDVQKWLDIIRGGYAMANLLAERQNVFWHDYDAIVAAGASAGIGLAALPPVRAAIGSGFDTKTITLSCGKLTTGVTVPQWSSILMLRNLKSPESYFQAAFRVQG